MILFFEDILQSALSQVGGKALSLARTLQAGLPVPAGFVITTDAYRNCSPQVSPALRTDIEQAYARLGAQRVAVRSSAVSEDSAEASFAGQQETILDVQGLDDLCRAIERCWKSLNTERVIAYRRQRHFSDDATAMAVVVQRLIAADVAGVLFTRDPLDVTGTLMSIEAAWGLGEPVVSGRITPDRFSVQRDSGEVQSRIPGLKSIRMTATGEQAVPADQRIRPCLTDTELSRLVELGRRVEALSGDARDIEWALADGRLWLLQDRPITTVSAFERETVRREVIAELQARCEPGGTIWTSDNLYESLPKPTPMTWAVVTRMLAENGGFGALYRDLGAEPDESLGELGGFDLVAGRPMTNLQRTLRLQFRDPPTEYPFAELKANPQLALSAKPRLNPLRGGWKALFRLPMLLGSIVKLNRQTERAARTFSERFTTEVAPKFAAVALAAMSCDRASQTDRELVALVSVWIQKTCIDFARESQKPTVFAATTWAKLENLLTVKLGAERTAQALLDVAPSQHLPIETSLRRCLQAVASGAMTSGQFRLAFGHRGSNELELAAPRWSENPETIPTIPLAKLQLTNDKLSRIRELIPASATVFDELQTWLELREVGKHWLLLGFAVLRKLLLELDRRFQLHGGIFHLVPGELPALIAGEKLQPLLAKRKRRRQIELGLDVPAVLFSDDLDAIGRAPEPEKSLMVHQGVAVSAGVAEGEAVVMLAPGSAPTMPFVLVCPSTDPAWVPLFAQAVAVVLESGGVLSHGAIVAREFGLPAVAGLPGITGRVKTGTRVRVDGTRGTVSIIPSPSSQP